MATLKSYQLRYLTRYPSDIIALPRTLIEAWNLHHRYEISISFGHKTVKALLKRHQGSVDHIWITPSLADKLMIPFQHTILIKYEDHKLSLGPLIGIVTCDAISDDGGPFTRNYQKYFTNLLNNEHLQNHPGYYFVFDLNSVNWDELTVEGYFYDPFLKFWNRYKVPFPDVVYNKILSRSRENRPDSQRFIERLHTMTKAKFFNEKYFHKWEIYERLSKIEELAHLIPETYYNPSLPQIHDMIRRYPIVYFKPVNGFMGLGIYQVSASQNRIIVRYRRNNRNMTKVYPSIQSFLQTELPYPKRREYVIQQGIDLLRVNGQPLDFRIHLNKNIENEWIVTGIGAKVAGKGSITTHMKAGGTILSPQRALEQVFPNKAEELLQKLHDTGIKISEALEQSFNKPLGELGIDVGIDQNGKLWLFEVNSKPGRAIFYKIQNLRSIEWYCNKLLLEYSIHLANFS